MSIMQQYPAATASFFALAGIGMLVSAATTGVWCAGWWRLTGVFWRTGHLIAAKFHLAALIVMAVTASLRGWFGLAYAAISIHAVVALVEVWTASLRPPTRSGHGATNT